MSPKTKDYAKRQLYAALEMQRVQYKALIRDFDIAEGVKRQCQEKLNSMPRNSSPTRVRNRCVLSGRGRGVHRFCRLSRIKIRQLAAKGWMTGLYKSSW